MRTIRWSYESDTGLTADSIDVTEELEIVWNNMSDAQRLAFLGVHEHDFPRTNGASAGLVWSIVEETHIAIATYNYEGEPDLYFVKVMATDDQIEDEKHLERASKYAKDDLGVPSDAPIICYDCVRNISGSNLHNLFMWETFGEPVEID